MKKKKVDESETPGTEEPETGAPESAGQDLEELLGILEAERDKLRAERDEKHELHLKARADLDNFRKRAARERPLLSAQVKRDLVSALLPSIDALDLAIKHASEDTDVGAFLEGVRSARDSIEKALAAQGVERIPVDGGFDPELHHAQAAVPSPDHPDGQIIEELRAGYRVGDLVARYSEVVVAKRPAGAAGPQADEADDREAEDAARGREE
jgi:molecular chaperone GrpE